MKNLVSILLLVVLQACATSSRAQYITVTVAGNGLTGFSGDNGPGPQANLNSPMDVCLDASNNVYFIDAGNSRVREVSATNGKITTIAGGGTSTADGIPATNALLSGLTKMAIDGAGNIYVSTLNEVRKISASTGNITTIAGSTAGGFSGDGGLAVSALLNSPGGICVDAAGNIYIADVGNNRVRKINGVTGTISTIAGNGASGTTGDGGAATAATLQNDNSVCVDASGNVYCANANAIRKIATGTGIITTLTSPGEINGICIGGGSSYIYYVQDSCGCIKYDLSTGTSVTIANNGADGYSGDGGNSVSMELNHPYGVCSDAAGNLYIADMTNNRIRKIGILTNSPSFIYGSRQLITPCPGIAAPLGTPLSVSELNVPATETWTVVTPPTIGTLSGFPATAASGGTASLAIPTGTTYTPGPGYTTGTDSFQVQVSNGSASAVVKIYVSIGAETAPGAISGGTSLCTGNTISMHESVPGLWTSSNSHGTISNSITGGVTTGISLTGASAGTDTITFSLPYACPLTSVAIVTVNPIPATAPIVGNDSVCVGATLSLTDPIAGGTWSSDFMGYASVGSTTGIVTGLTTGSADISYTLTNSFGCHATVSIAITIAASADPISGASSVCVGSSIPLYEDISGGTWSITNGNAHITGTGTSVSITGVAAGTDTVLYTNTNVCGTGTVKKVVTINPLVTPGTVSGPSSVCTGATITLTPSIPGGTWSDANGDVFLYGGGYLEGNTAGVDTVYYGPTCATSLVATVITVNPPPGGTITGAGFVCVGSTAILSDVTPGGTWSVSNSNATIMSSGPTTAVVTGVSWGTDVVSYTSTNMCGTGTVTMSIAVDTTISSSGTISGPASVCAGSNVTYTHTGVAGLWSVTNVTATIATTGVVTGVSAGADTIIYTSACALHSATAVVTVNPLPAIAAISGADTVCVGATIIMSDAVSGGTWSRVIGIGGLSITVAATTGIVTGSSFGTGTVKYTTTSGGCSSSVTKLLTVYAPVVAISGTSTVCLASSVTLTESVPGGTWSIDNGHASLATTSSTSAIITGVTTGQDTVIYSNTNVCGTGTVTETISVDPPAIPGTISGASSLCLGSGSSHYTETSSGGAWSTTNASAHIGPAGNLTAYSAGVDTIIYTVNSGCHTATTTFVVTINSAVSAISGSTSVCVGASMSLSDATAGGTWSMSNADATISASGLLAGVIPGTDTVTYSTGSGVCGPGVASATIVINPLPDAGSISSPTDVCAGSSMTATDIAPGGVWSEVSGHVSVSAAGYVTGITAGPDVLSYTVTTACGTAVATASLTVDPEPAAGIISGATIVCVGSSISLFETISGGVWSASNGDATVTSAGAVAGITAGTDVISYTVTNSCGTAIATQATTVEDIPDAGIITGNSETVCIGSTIELTDGVADGTWNTVTGNASVTGGNITGISAGNDTVVYLVTNSCGTASTSLAITVDDCSTTGIPAVTDPSVRVYPNPVSNLLSIEWMNLQDKHASIVFTDIAGRVVLQTNFDNNSGEGTLQQDLSNFSNGVYLLTISSATLHYTGKVVVDRH